MGVLQSSNMNKLLNDFVCGISIVSTSFDLSKNGRNITKNGSQVVQDDSRIEWNRKHFESSFGDRFGLRHPP